ncbi:MerR family transcriptional regulator [Glycomyces sp. NPDC047010]|uniref:MerR family transcriptional regulator n=1 Tax=Glycomyces sp. NPDC047010 TaxID=3155023 RepID=UPI0033E5250F
MWRIGRLARMAGVSERTLRHYDRIGLLPPAAVERATGYRWYGAAELVRLERIRGLQRLGLTLREIESVVDAPDEQVRQLLEARAALLRSEIAAMTAALAAAEDRLAVAAPVLPQVASVGERRLKVRRIAVAHPSELAAACEDGPGVLLTWLTGAPGGGFEAAVAAPDGEALDLPARRVVRAVVPEECGVRVAGEELFAWLGRQRLSVAGPTVEERLVDGDGAAATVLEVPVR